MNKNNDNYLIVKPESSNFSLIREFLEKELSEFDLNPHFVQETVLIVEEIFVIACEKSFDGYDAIIRARKTLGALNVEIEYDGDRFELDIDDANDVNLGNRIIGRYSDKISWRYRRKRNRINLLVTRKMARNIKQSLIMAMAGLLIGQACNLFLSASQQAPVLNIAVEAETIFAYLMVMISAPVTFFSIVTNLSNISVNLDRDVPIKRLLIDILYTSIIALIIGAILANLFNASEIIPRYGETLNDIEVDWFNFGIEMVPKDIFEAFTVLSPYPLIILASIVAIALINMKSHFQQMKSLNDSLNELVQSALEIIYYLLPIAVFFTFVDVGIYSGVWAIFTIAMLVALFYVCAGIMQCVYGIRLTMFGINPVLFFRDCAPAMRENFNIGTPIDAIPYNIRFCNRTFGMKIKRLDVVVPVLSQLNHDGNCIMIMMMTIFCLLRNDVNITFPEYIAIGVLVLALSVGAPNCAGSLFIGLIVTLSCFGEVSGIAWLLIYLEAFAGNTLSMVNTMGNLTTIAVDAKKSGELDWKYIEPEERRKGE